MERELYSKNKLLEAVEDDHKKATKLLKDEFKKDMAVLEMKLSQQYFALEDALSGTIRREDFIIKRNADATAAESAKKKLEREKLA